MFCNACETEVTRTDHVLFSNGVAYCRPSIEADYGSVEAFLAEEAENDEVEELDIDEFGMHAGAVVREEV